MRYDKESREEKEDGFETYQWKNPSRYFTNLKIKIKDTFVCFICAHSKRKESSRQILLGTGKAGVSLLISFYSVPFKPLLCASSWKQITLDPITKYTRTHTQSEVTV